MPPNDLAVSTALRRSLRKYKAKLPHVAAAEALGMAGKRVETGSLVDFVYVDAGHHNPFRRVRPAGYEGEVDAEKYVALVREAAKSILMPFGVDVHGGRSQLGGTLHSLRLDEFGSKIPKTGAGLQTGG